MLITFRALISFGTYRAGKIYIKEDVKAIYDTLQNVGYVEVLDAEPELKKMVSRGKGKPEQAAGTPDSSKADNITGR